ncbi:MAG: OmpA family protein [Bacteroidales bacterium]|nr:OmpA family protein [Bacteroidales bacterium]
MRTSLIISLFSVFILLLSPAAEAQIKVDLKGKINREVNRRANQKADEAVKAGLDKTEEGIKNAVTGKEQDAGAENKAGEKPGEAGKAEAGNAGQNARAEGAAAREVSLSWSRYDFVPGDAVIFEDNLMNEENGEFPSRWDLIEGNVEIARVDGENVIMMRDGGPTIVPYLKNAEEDYLPDVFTIEIDLYYPNGSPFNIYLYDRKNQRSNSPTGYTYLTVDGNEMRMGKARSKYPEEKDLKRWMHISIAYTDGKLKAYLDDTRLINIPRLDFNPSGLSFHAYHASNENLAYIKNIRIAKGGVKYYDRVMQDGKIIVNGIRFDTGKSTLKPESMGPINEIFKIMQENPGLKFSVEGHTDSQGEDAFNLKLSEERAQAVMNTLVKMGIAADRLSSKGWGESKPISDNASPEDMANNRRVEFVKI